MTLPSKPPTAPAPARHAFADLLRVFKAASGKEGRFYSLPALARQFPAIGRLPISIRIVLESVLRNCDGRKITAEHVRQLACWAPRAERKDEIAFVVARVVLQDFTGVPLLADLAAMRSQALRLGQNPQKIEPLVPVDLVVDHSIMVDHYGRKDALDLNMKLEFQRNRERYEFMKWGMQAFDRLGVVPPGFGIVHQVNLEYLARGVHQTGDGIHYPDTLVGTDSHTTMINGIGVVGWGVGGIEAEAAMLGQPVYFLTPDVVGVELAGQLREGVTATDLVLTVTELLRQHKVVGKFVEFFGAGTRTLALPDRATIANMAPEYGATMGFFPVDEKTIAYFQGTGRSQDEIEVFEAYFKAQGLFGVPLAGELDYSQVIRLDLGSVTPSLAGPKRPQDRIELGQVSRQFARLFSQPDADNGFNRPAGLLHQRVALRRDGAQGSAAGNGDRGITVGNGDVLIAAITSCTNTSNPGVLLAAGLLAKKAVAAGLVVQPHIKTSLAPGSRIVTEYLAQTGLLPYLEQLGFALVGYGCTTCIGNAGDLAPELNEAITRHQLVCASVLSGNRNFEARIHPNLKANFLASPPLVVAYAIAGTVLKDLMTEPVGQGRGGRDIYLGDIWPSSEEIGQLMQFAMNGPALRASYARIATDPGPLWQQIEGVDSKTYRWPASTYIAEPPFFADFAIKKVATGGDESVTLAPAVHGARIMALFGDSITTDHISPAGAIDAHSPAGQWLLQHGVLQADFNSYGARRGHHEVMMRGSFANVRIKNLMLPPGADGAREEGGLTLFQGDGALRGHKLSIFDAAMQYQAQGRPTVIFAGEEYGTGSSRDWAAKGTQLLGIEAVVARSFERIHRANLVGMGVLPLQFQAGDSWQTLGLAGDEVIDVLPDPALRPQSQAQLVIHRADGTRQQVAVTLRIDTPIEVDYYQAGGILPYVLRQLLQD
ncbi:aconitate hydratase AcnA [Verminephrobacter eiseniae]|uniref:aconitate hydratase AcnA n=1 Tax=Verminephrobacter eiseniae TaxID=364317 RepID=UPI0022380F95|nr:aconitate hydratase AcnA [Verminephrobacter eiseniae]MCW5236150.1 aconitate hydratase AcnA [Verminephrobacter eiseniae]